MSNNNGTSIWPVIFIVLVVATIIQMLVGGSGGGSTYVSPSADSSSFEHRYVQERFKQEGYNSSEAKTAADAVMKFHNAQKNR